MSRQKHILRVIGEPLALAFGLALLIRAAVMIFSIPSASMEPTLHAGDVIVVTPYWRGEPSPGEVVVFRHPSSNQVLVKRVIAAAGEYVEADRGLVRVGGHTLAEPYVERRTSELLIAPQIVPPASYFVLGDNRPDSVDSRLFGAVEQSRIIGRARLILWSSSGSGASSAHALSPASGGVSRRELIRVFKWIE